MSVSTKLFLIIPLLVWMGVIYYLSSVPGTSIKTTVPDYLVHMVEYGILAILMYRITVFVCGLSIKSNIITVILAGFYGVIDEVHQLFVPGRTSTLRDIVFDIIGAVLSLLFLWFIVPKLPKYLRLLCKRMLIPF